MFQGLAGRAVGEAGGRDARTAQSVFLRVLFLCLALCLALQLACPAAQAAGEARIAKNLKALGISENPKTFAGVRLVARAELKESYEKGKTAMDELRAHKTRSCWRQPWEELRDTFLGIAVSSPHGNQAAQALFRAGECQEELARC